MERGPPEPGRQRSQVKKITKRRCRPRTLIIRFHHLRHSPLTLLLRPTLPLRPTRPLCPILLLLLITCLDRRARAQAPIRLLAQRHRPHRRLESFTRDSILPRPWWLPWLSRRACEAILFARRTHYRGPDFQKSHSGPTHRSFGHRYCNQAAATGWDLSNY